MFIQIFNIIVWIAIAIVNIVGVKDEKALKIIIILETIVLVISNLQLIVYKL